jgi:hypothetical protein
VARKKIMDRLTPPRFDFYGMLTEQAEVTAAGIDFLARWLQTPTADNYRA